MPSKKNLAEVAFLKDRLSSAKAVIFCDYKGLTVAQITALRKKVQAAGGQLKVSKNTLLKLALKAKNYPLAEIEKNLIGPTAVVFSLEDEVGALKTLWDFSQEFKLPKLKAGFLGTDFLGQEKLIELAQLPAKPILLAKLAGILNAPLVGLMSVLQGNQRKLLYLLKVISEKKVKQ